MNYGKSKHIGETKMNDFIKTLLSLSVSGSVLFLLLWGFKPLYKNQFSRRWQYYIWLVAALRFVLPFTPNTTIIGSLFTACSPDTFAATNTVQTFYSSIQAAPAAAQTPFDLSFLLFIVWSAGVFAALIRKITMYQAFTHSIRAGSTEVSDLKTLNVLSDCMERLSVKKRVELYQSPLAASPFMIGCFHPSIILPVKELTEQEQTCIFTHELIHYRQKDLLYKWFIQLILCLHWFNPVVYMLEKEVNSACELSCDEILIMNLDKDARRAYGDVLIKFLKVRVTYNFFASVTLTADAKHFKERLGAIMHYKKQTTFMKTVSLLAAILLSAGAFALGAYTAPPASPVSSTGFVNYTVRQEDGIFYIYCDGACESDQPTGGISKNSIGFVLVRKDGYATLTGFRSIETLLADVEKQCDDMLLHGTITQEERDIVLETAAAYDSGIIRSIIYDKQGAIVGSFQI